MVEWCYWFTCSHQLVTTNALKDVAEGFFFHSQHLTVLHLTNIVKSRFAVTRYLPFQWKRAGEWFDLCGQGQGKTQTFFSFFGGGVSCWSNLVVLFILFYHFK